MTYNCCSFRPQNRISLGNIISQNKAHQKRQQEEVFCLFYNVTQKQATFKYPQEIRCLKYSKHTHIYIYIYIYIETQ